MRPAVCMIACVLLVIPALSLAASTDPVLRYIADADSLARIEDGEILDAYVAQHAVLGGAAVGKLLETAFEPSERGNAQARDERLALAGRIARAYERATGSSKPLQLIAVYESWTLDQCALRDKAVALDKGATEARNSSDLERAVRLYHQARELYASIGDARSVAIIWGSLGIAHWHRNDMDAVRASYDAALSARRDIEDRILEGRTLNGLGSVSFQKGGYEDAISFYDQAIELRLKTDDIEGLITSYTYRGAVYDRLEDLVKARASFEAALPFLDRAGTSMQKSEIFNNLGSLYARMGRFTSANESYRSSIDLAVASGDALREASSRMNLADNLRIGGQYREALGELDAAQSALDKRNDPVQSAGLHSKRGLVYMSMGELDRAREDLLTSLRETETLEDPRYQIEALLDLGALYFELNAHANALENALQAKEMAERLGDKKLMRKASVAAGASEVLLGHYDSALAYIEQALEWDRERKIREYLIEDLFYQATIECYMGKLVEGRTTFESVRAMMHDLGRSDLAWAVLFGIGHTYEKQNPDSASFYYERAFAEVEKTGAAIGGAEIRTGFFSDERRRWYEDVARYYASLSRGGREREWSTKAFQTLERAKARGLLDLLQSTIRQDASAEEEALIDSLYALGTSTPDAREARRHLEQRYIELRDARTRREVGGLESRGRIAAIDDIQNILPDRTKLLEYALGDTVSFLWVVGRDEQALFEIPSRSAIQQEVTKLRDAIAKPGAGDAILRQTARTLYEMLVEPGENMIAGSRILIIVPDGILFELPFEMLIAGEPDMDAAWNDCAFLARSYETLYVPSSSICLELGSSAAQKGFGRDLVAVGNPDFSTLAVKAGFRGGRIPQLPHAEDEVRAIESLFPAERRIIMVGTQADETAFKRTLKDGSARIVHLATHGYADPVEPMASSIFLCRSEGSIDDGYLHTLEILSLPLNGGLVVLSACESGRGRLSRGEGVVGLSRAFFAAGARGVIASLWPVGDASTGEMMKTFYEKMYAKKRPAREALKEARLSLMRNPAYAHPFFWAPFILLGDEATPWER